MLSLINSPAFQNEYKTWKTEIENITDEKLQIELNRLLSELVSQVRFLDTQHLDLMINNRLSAQSNESKARILDLRKTIDQKIKKYKEISN